MGYNTQEEEQLLAPSRVNVTIPFGHPWMWEYDVKLVLAVKAHDIK